MIKFTDKLVLDVYGIDCEYVRRELDNLFPENKKGNLVDLIQSVSEKIVDDYITTGKLDAYIAKYGTTFIDELKKTAERDIGVVLISAMNDWGLGKTENWHLSLYATGTQKNYSEWVETKTEWGSTSHSEHKLTEKYASDLTKIKNFIETDMASKIVDDDRHLNGTIRILTQFISDEIRTKEDALDEQVLVDAKRELNSKTPYEDLDRYFREDKNKKEKIENFNLVVGKIINQVVQDGHPIVFNGLSESKKNIAKQEMTRAIVENVCDTLCESESALYNGVRLRDESIKKMDVGVDFSDIDIGKFAEEIANITIIPQIQYQHDVKLEHFAEEGYDIQPEDECQWEEFEYLVLNEMNSVYNISVAIQNGINEGMQNVLNYLSKDKTEIGDEVLNNNVKIDDKPKGAISRFVDAKNDSERNNREENTKDEETI